MSSTIASAFDAIVHAERDADGAGAREQRAQRDLLLDLRVVDLGLVELGAGRRADRVGRRFAEDHVDQARLVGAARRAAAARRDVRLGAGRRAAAPQPPPRAQRRRRAAARRRERLVVVESARGGGSRRRPRRVVADEHRVVQLGAGRRADRARAVRLGAGRRADRAAPSGSAPSDSAPGGAPSRRARPARAPAAAAAAGRTRPCRARRARRRFRRAIARRAPSSHKLTETTSGAASSQSSAWRLGDVPPSSVRGCRPTRPAGRASGRSTARSRRAHGRRASAPATLRRASSRRSGCPRRTRHPWVARCSAGGAHGSHGSRIVPPPAPLHAQPRAWTRAPRDSFAGRARSSPPPAARRAACSRARGGARAAARTSSWRRAARRASARACGSRRPSAASRRSAAANADAARRCRRGAVDLAELVAAVGRRAHAARDLLPRPALLLGRGLESCAAARRALGVEDVEEDPLARDDEWLDEHHDRPGCRSSNAACTSRSAGAARRTRRGSSRSTRTPASTRSYGLVIVEAVALGEVLRAAEVGVEELLEQRLGRQQPQHLGREALGRGCPRGTSGSYAPHADAEIQRCSSIITRATVWHMLVSSTNSGRLVRA